MTQNEPLRPSRAGTGARSMIETIILILVGTILLLPGLCSFGFALGFLAGGQKDILASSPILLLWIVCFAISLGGIMLIRAAIRGRQWANRAPGAPQT